MNDILLNNLLNTCKHNARIKGHICLNIDRDATTCRNIFVELVETFANDENNTLSKITLLELPTNDFTSNEYSLSFIEQLQNVNDCILVGGRRSKGKRTKGGITLLPRSFSKLILLNTLDVSFNKLKCIPVCLKNLSNLEILRMDFNNIEILAIPEGGFAALKELHLKSNIITQVDDDILSLKSLQGLHLESNKLVELPDTLHLMKSLQHLNVTENRLKMIQLKLFQSKSLQVLEAAHNDLDNLPILESENIPLLRLDLRYNYITNVSNVIKSKSCILLDGNVSREPQKHQKEQMYKDIYDVPVHYISHDSATLSVTACVGGKFVLRSGITIIFPKNCLIDDIDISCKLTPFELESFNLRATDQLLSNIIEMKPSGTNFNKAVQIVMPFSFCSLDHQERQIVLRCCSGVNESLVYEDLKSDLNKDESTVTATTTHFSCFAVISRLVENTINVEQGRSALLVSSVNCFNKIYFPEESVEDNTSVTMQVLSVDPNLVSNISNSLESYTSDILQVQVTPPGKTFNCPVTVHLSLPQELMGKSFNKSHLHLLQSKDNSEEWNDVTSALEPKFTLTDVYFEVWSFCKFWLVWRTVCGVARQVYRRLVTYQVQFLAMQRTKLPTVVLAQCVLANQIEERVQQLKKSGYSGEDPCTIIIDLTEGSKFRIRVFGELQIKNYSEADRQHMEEHVLLVRFHSQYPPDKDGFCRFCIEPTSSSRDTISTGHISFYLVDEPIVEVAGELRRSPRASSKARSAPEKRGHDRDRDATADPAPDRAAGKGENADVIQQEALVHLADVLITLQKSDLDLNIPEDRTFVFNYDELGAGMFKDLNLRYIASQIGAEWEEIGHYLGLRTYTMDRIKMDYPASAKEQIFRMLNLWAIRHSHEQDCVETFTEALKDAGRTDLAQKVTRIYSEGTESFRKKQRKELSDLGNSIST